MKTCKRATSWLRWVRASLSIVSQEGILPRGVATHLEGNQLNLYMLEEPSRSQLSLLRQPLQAPAFTQYVYGVPWGTGTLDIG